MTTLTGASPEAALAIAARHPGPVTIVLAERPLAVSPWMLARALGVAPATVQRLIVSGQIPSVQVRPEGRGPSTVVPWTEAEAFVRRRALPRSEPTSVSALVLAAICDAGPNGISRKDLETAVPHAPSADAVRSATYRHRRAGRVTSSDGPWTKSHWTAVHLA